MDLNPLTAISPVDGRYHNQTGELASYFSEFGLIRYRVWVETEYFIALHKAGIFHLNSEQSAKIDTIRSIYKYFELEDAKNVKEIEKKTNHDVKAVEYYLKNKFDELGFSEYKEFIHFGLTSQDINNTAIPALVRDFLKDIYSEQLDALINKIDKLADEWKGIPMLSRTHGQPASPTRIGKEFLVFSERLKVQKEMLLSIPWSAKFGGAVGNFNAHVAAYPRINWIQFADDFVNKVLGLSRTQTTTQIEHYDNISALMDNLSRINNILIDLCRDVWMYISMEYFHQKISEVETGSSTMPHKINPVDFENAEGNLGMANAVFSFMSVKLPVSRLQRDLSDSTVLRNIGVPMAHTIISFKSILKGLDKLILNKAKIENDLENNWVVVAEAIQTILRRERYPEPYEALKSLTRQNKPVTKTLIHEFIETLNISDKVKAELKNISPQNYTGI